MAGLTLDGGAIIGFQRADRRTMAHLKEAERQGLDLTVPTAVVAEVWRGESRAARVAALLACCTVEPLSEEVARRAAQALGAVKGASVVDSIVVCSAAQRGDRVLTSHVDGLTRLSARVGGARIVGL